MEHAIKLTTKQVPRNLQKLDGYNGRKFKAVITNEVTIPIDAGLWSGGSREYFMQVSVISGQPVALPGQNNFYDGRKEQTFHIRPDQIIVRHSHFCGKDSGLTFFIHPESEWAKEINQVAQEV